ncbi:SDR family oxidoreductase [Thalassotalea montiporae]
MNKLQLKTLASSNVLLTGATGGIGQATAKLLCKAGANLVLLGRSQEKLEQLQRELQANCLSSEQRVFAIQVDITDENDRQTLLTALQALPFKVNTLINNAGISQFALLEQTSPAQLENMLVTNSLAPMQLTQCLLPMLLTQDSAQIINVGSTFGSIGYPGYTAYCTSKYALRGFSESLGRELADTQVAVKYFSPRATATTINSDAVNQLNKVLKTATDSPELVAQELVTLLASRKRERYIGWPERFFVKLNQLFPNLVGQSIAKQLPVIKSFALKC